MFVFKRKYDPNSGVIVLRHTNPTKEAAVWIKICKPEVHWQARALCVFRTNVTADSGRTSLAVPAERGRSPMDCFELMFAGIDLPAIAAQLTERACSKDGAALYSRQEAFVAACT